MSRGGKGGVKKIAISGGGPALDLQTGGGKILTPPYPFPWGVSSSGRVVRLKQVTNAKMNATIGGNNQSSITLKNMGTHQRLYNALPGQSVI